MTTTHALKIFGLAKTFKKRPVVKEVSLEISSSEIVGLLGPNGAGKTTSFYMVVGLIPADAGHIILDDQDITELPMHERAQRGITYLPQEPSIFRKLTVEQNILAILELQKSLSRDDCLLQLENLLDDFNLQLVRKSLGISLSGGERRRVEIARALATQPHFILLDEPFAGIDPISIMDIKNLIRRLSKRGIGILITDHNVRETLDICERAYIVNEGKILCSGSPQDILNNQEARKIYLGEHFRLINE